MNVNATDSTSWDLLLESLKDLEGGKQVSYLTVLQSAKIKETFEIVLVSYNLDQVLNPKITRTKELYQNYKDANSWASKISIISGLMFLPYDGLFVKKRFGPKDL